MAEALLCGVGATVSATAAATGHSTSSTAHALATLGDLDLLKATARRGRNSGRFVTDVDRLLQEYADAAARLRPTVELRCGVLWREPFVAVEELGERWDRGGIRWAVTGTLGASIRAPYLTEITDGEVYVDASGEPELRMIAQVAGIDPMPGGRLVLRPFPTLASDRLAEPIGGIMVAPLPRVYADVRQVGVRGEEAAEHMWEVAGGR